MGVHIEDSKVVIITESKIIHFSWPKDFDNNLKYEIDFFIKHNFLLAEYTIKNKINKLLFKHKHGSARHKHGKQ